ncbi:alpha/beta fold hydrolase [Homoserinimonas sp. A520]
MTDTIFDGITQHEVRTPRLRASVLERPSNTLQKTVLFIHGNVSSSLFWQPTMLALPDDVRALAVDLRGFGDSETLPVDAARGLGDYADDVASVLDELGIRSAHLVGWSMGGGVAMQLLLDRPELFATLTLVAPVSPYGFGGTTGPDGRMLTADGAGTGGGGANPDFVARLAAGDTSADEPTSPRSVLRSAYVKNGESLPFEDVWVQSMLSTKTGDGNYPGNSTPSESWPGFAPGNSGVLNTMAPTRFNVSRIADAAAKPPILWIHGTDDAIASDTSFFDLNYLGQLGAIPGWPGEEVAPPQPMKAQTRAVLDRYQANGGEYREVELAECGHSPHLEHPTAFAEAFHAHIA